MEEVDTCHYSLVRHAGYSLHCPVSVRMVDSAYCCVVVVVGVGGG
jgi:hypothetical protein